MGPLVIVAVIVLLGWANVTIIRQFLRIVERHNLRLEDEA